MEGLTTAIILILIVVGVILAVYFGRRYQAKKILLIASPTVKKSIKWKTSQRNELVCYIAASLNELQAIEDDNLYFQETISWNNNRIKAWKILRKKDEVEKEKASINTTNDKIVKLKNDRLSILSKFENIAPKAKGSTISMPADFTFFSAATGDIVATLLRNPKFCKTVNGCRILLCADFYVVQNGNCVKIKDIEKYFDEYKWLKVENLISQSFLERVEIEAKERNFYRILPPRSEQLGKLKKENSILYFLDALGVEYLSFIAQKAAELHLMMNVIICHSELPSITSMNKEFVDVFKQANADVRDNIKELDDIKHSGTLEYNYAKSIYPTYLADELSIISDVLEKIDADITSTYERAYIISDHGASRLAVLKHSETKWEMLNKGEHCGRCCKKSDNVVDVPNEYMTEDNGYWVLANYDMFKGGRPGTVEVHGGATLEEVCVPIIEFTRMPENINVEVITKTVKTGYKIKPLLQFVTNCKLHNVKVLIGEREYLAQSDDDLHFTAELQGLRIEKEYMFEVVADGNIRIENLKFRLKSSGIIDNDIL